MRLRVILAFVIVLAAIFTFRFSSLEKPEEFVITANVMQQDTGRLYDLMNQYDQYLLAEMDSTQTVGAAVAIVYKGRVEFIKPYGVRSAGSQDSIDIETVFRLASVSKSFAGALACILEQEGTLFLSDKVVDHIPDFRLKDSINTHDLTIAQSLAHTSGLVPHAFDNLIEADYSLGQLIGELHLADVSAKPGVYYGYQNVVFSLIDTIAEAATNKPYERLLRQKIFRPLHMNNASASYRGFLSGGNYALPHSRTKNGYVALSPNDGYYNVLPAAGVNASIRDLSNYLLGMMGYKPEVFGQALIDSLTSPRIHSPLKRRYTRAWGQVDDKHYALGWRIYNYRGRDIITHGGFVRGYRVELAFSPEDEVGIAFVQNSPNRLASESTPTFFNMFLDYQEQKALAEEEAQSDSSNIQLSLR